MKAFFAKITAFFLAILAFFGLGPKTPEPETPATGNDGYAIIENGVQFWFDANATTGFSWAQTQQGDSVTLEKEYYVSPKTEPPLAGQGGTQYYVYRAVKPGTTTITFTYQRPWEQEPPARTFTAVVVVADDLSVTVSSFGEQ
ncbi:MAG: protease inhibitor I42 family protein [Oscillospiraceae bacterium]|nr:protease inhibitor I42 family protein [Oscillospiraceae bacterium]